MLDKNLIAVLLGVCVVACVVIGCILVLKQPEVAIPEFIKTVAATAIGALAALAVPTQKA